MNLRVATSMPSRRPRPISESPGTAGDPKVGTTGIALCLVSAACFGALPVLGRIAYGQGISVAGLLGLRFALAAALFWLAVRLWKPPWPGAPVARRAFLLGMLGYAPEAGLYFWSLERTGDASLTEVLLYLYPVLVTVASVWLRFVRLDWRLAVAVPSAVLGVGAVAGGALQLDADRLGVLAGVGAAVIYAGYVLVASVTAERVSPVLMSALVCSGAATAFGLGAATTGSINLRLGVSGWTSVLLIAVVSTNVAVLALFAGIRRIGGARASVVSTVEPVATLALAAALLGEGLGTVEAAGTGAVLLAVLLVRAPRPEGQKKSGGGGGGEEARDELVAS